MKFAHPKRNNAHQFQHQKVKGQDHQVDYCLYQKCIISFERNAYELQNWYTYRARRPVWPTSAVTSSVKGQSSKVTWSVRCWPISRERKVLETTPQAIMRNKFEVKRSEVKSSPGWLMLKMKVCHLRTSNLVCGWSMRYQLPWPAIKAWKVGFLHTGGGVPCRPQSPATQLV